MKSKKDNLLNLADNYQNLLIEDDEFDYYNEENLKKIFKDIISDYKKILKKCKKEGIDVGSSEEQQYQKLFDMGTIDEKEDVIGEIKENVKSLLDLCDIPNISEKYFIDLVNILDGEDIFEE